MDLQTLRDHLSLRDLAEEAGAAFHNGYSCCPLHGGDNPTAFHLYQGGQRWHCFTRCPPDSNDGDVFTFTMRWKGVDFKTALHDLSLRSAIPIPCHSERSDRSQTAESPERREAATKGSPLHPYSPIPLSPNPVWVSRARTFIEYAAAQLRAYLPGIRARAYLFNERGLDPQTWDAFDLGYNPETIYEPPERWGLEPGSGKICLPRGIVIPGLQDGQPSYLKIRRPLPGDLLAEYIPSDSPTPLSPIPLKGKFGGPRGGHATLFGAGLFLGSPLLLLVEGEWDAMLAWQLAGDLVDVATLGGAGRRTRLPDLAALARYPQVLAVTDADPSGERGRQYLAGLPRVRTLTPPDHDLSDYFRSGKDLRAWIARHVTECLPPLVAGLDPQLHAEKLEEWQLILAEARRGGEAGTRGRITRLNG